MREASSLFQGSRAAKLKGAGFMLLWALSFSTTMSLAKTLSPDLHTLMIVFMRYFFGLIFFSPFIMRARLQGFTTSRPLLHMFRVMCVGIAGVCSYYAYRNLPLVMATSIGMSTPLFTTVFAMLLLKESVSFKKWLVIFFGYIGVLVMVRPHALPIGSAAWVAIAANIFAGLSIICVKSLSRTESTFTMMLYINTITTFIAGILVIGVWETPSVHDCIVLGMIGGLGLLSQYSMVKAMTYANPSYLSPFEYTRMCFAIPVGYFLFKELPTFWVLAGSCIIIVATYMLTRLELRGSQIR